MSADRNLLCGVLALQMGFVSKDQLLEALAAWVMDKATPLGELMRRRGWLAGDSGAELDRAVARHLARHGAPSDHESPDTVAPEASGSTVAPTGTATPPAPPVSRYRRLAPLARGGMGEVSVALDGELGREVALKEIQNRYADLAGSRARFVREAEVTGRLEHPGIVPVYGLGRHPDGRPYYAMRLIRGTSLDDAIKCFHASPPGAERSLGLRRLLGQFVAVCQAVAYAHSKGVIHRDLKPGNVMLGEFGEVLVVDWGLARRRGDGAEGAGPAPGDGSELTEPGQAVGTPAYMPPEQARGEHGQVGPASDVFALGGTLHCLLTGRPPRAAEPGPGRAPAALAAVCARAMAERPEDRYASAAELAREVERWLAGEPVSAYRDPLSVKLGRWVRRHRPLVTGAVVLLVASVVGLAGGLYAVGAEKAKTEDALGREQANLRTAEANLKLAEQAVGECFAIAKDEPLLQGPRLKQVRRLLFEKARPYYQRFRAERPADPKLAREQAQQLFAWAYIENEIGDKRAALMAYQQVRDDFLRLAERHRNADSLADLARAGEYLGSAWRDVGDAAAALREYEQAQAAWVQLTKEHPAAEYRAGLARSHSHIGLLLRDRGRQAEASARWQQARDLQQQLVAELPEGPQYRLALIITHHNLALVIGPPDALREYDRGRDLCRALLTDYPGLPDARDELARGHHNRGALLEDLKRPKEALAEYLQAHGLRVQLDRDFPGTPLYQQQLATTRSNLGNLLDELGRTAEALAEYAESAALRRRLVAGHPAVPGYAADLASTYFNLALLLAERGRPDEARRAFSEVIRLVSGLHQAGQQTEQTKRQLSDSYYKRAQALGQVGRWRAALADYERDLAITTGRAQLPSRFGRAEARARLGEHAPATAEAGELAKVLFVAAEERVDLARVFAVCAKAAASDPLLPLPRRGPVVDAYARAAVAQLARAASGGYFKAAANLQALDRDADFALLRERDDYRRFRAALPPPAKARP